MDVKSIQNWLNPVLVGVEYDQKDCESKESLNENHDVLESGVLSPHGINNDASPNKVVYLANNNPVARQIHPRYVNGFLPVEVLFGLLPSII